MKGIPAPDSGRPQPPKLPEGDNGLLSRVGKVGLFAIGIGVGAIVGGGFAAAGLGLAMLAGAVVIVTATIATVVALPVLFVTLGVILIAGAIFLSKQSAEMPIGQFQDLPEDVDLMPEEKALDLARLPIIPSLHTSGNLLQNREHFDNERSAEIFTEALANELDIDASNISVSMESDPERADLYRLDVKISNHDYATYIIQTSWDKDDNLFEITALLIKT